MNSSLKAEIRGAMSRGFLKLTGGRLNKCCACRSMNANWIDAYGEMSTTAFFGNYLPDGASRVQ